MSEPAHILPFRHAPYVPPPAKPLPRYTFWERHAGTLITFGAMLCALLALAAFAWMMKP